MTSSVRTVRLRTALVAIAGLSLVAAECAAGPAQARIPAAAAAVATHASSQPTTPGAVPPAGRVAEQPYAPTARSLDGIPTRTVTYRGVGVQVPTSWPVVDLDRHPGACVRLDRTVVYVGSASADQDCPAHLVGRGDSVWLAPATTSDRAAATGTVRASGTAAGTTRLAAGTRSVSGQSTVVAGGSVAIRTADDGNPAVVDAVVASAHDSTAKSSTDQAGSLASPNAVSTNPGPDGGTAADASKAGRAAAAAATASSPASPRAGPAATSQVSGDVHYTGMAFDTCAAPSTATMAAWRASPYATVGIYIGGALRACGDGNLSSSWVSAVRGQGWGFLPLYVGLQAPCNTAGLRSFTAANAASEGSAAAADAVAEARSFGFPAGTTIQYDMEYYSTDSSCRSAVLTFMTAWTKGVQSRGYRSGAYGSVSALMVDMANAVAAHTTSFTPPDDVWYARWDGLQTVSAQAAYPAFRDTYWAGKRHHQYLGNVTETWGGTSINIDANWSDGHVAGTPVQADYPGAALGPGSSGFVFTGSMTYWRPQPGQGVMGRSYWTHPSGSSTEYNGATWLPVLGTGLYSVQANVPSGGSTGLARYTLTSASGTATTTLNQAGPKGYRSIGSVLVKGGVTARIHLGDNAGGSTASTIAADSLLFTRTASAPAAPTNVRATPGDGRAAVSWSAAASNGSAVTGYTVTASPGGARVSVGGTTTSATMTGLTDGTAYTFTVTATNLVGTGPGGTSPAVVPTRAGRLATFTPVRLADTRVGTAANPRRGALKPGETATLRVAGVTGSPVPAGASGAYLNVTVTGATRSGYVAVSPTGTTSSSTVNFLAGQTVANLALVGVRSDGTIQVRNGSSGPVQVVLDAQGAVAPGTTGGLWNAVTPARILDTRSGTASNARRTALAPGEALKVAVANQSGSPVPVGATAAALNVTAVGATVAGYLSVSPTGSTTSSSLNLTPGRTVANLAVTGLASDGTVTVTNRSPGTLHLVIDVQGYAGSTGSLISPASPVRLADTRSGTAVDPVKGALAAGGSMTLRVAGVSGSPVPSVATAGALNVTVVGPTGSGQLRVADGGTSISSTANFTRGATVAALTMTRLSASGTVVVTNQSGGSVHIVVDVEGFAAP